MPVAQVISVTEHVAGSELVQAPTTGALFPSSSLHYSALIARQPGLLGYWALDADYGVTDLSTGGNNGTAAGGVTIGGGTGPGSLTSTDFDGSDDRVTTTYGVRRNLVTNPTAAVDLTGWGQVNLTTWERVASLPTTGGLPTGVTTGFHAATSTNGARGQFTLAVTSGVTYTFTIYVRLAANTATGVGAEIRNLAFASKGNSTTLSTVGGDFTRLTLTVTADATENWTFNTRQVGAGSTEWHFSAVMIEVASSAGTYFDGSTGPDTAWEGTANASVSSKGPFANGSVRTFEGWANRDTSAGNDALFGGSPSGVTSAVLILRSTGQVDWYVGTGVNVNMGTWPGTAQWVHWMLVFNEPADTATLYLNGVSQGVKADANTYGATTALLIGAWANPIDFFDGKIAHVAVYNSDMSFLAPIHYAAGITTTFGEGLWPAA